MSGPFLVYTNTVDEINRVLKNIQDSYNVSLTTIASDAKKQISSALNTTVVAATTTGVPTSRQINTGEGLQGGGSLASDLTLSIVAATSTTLGGVKPDGTSILNSSGAISVTKASIGLGNVENTALSTWPGTANVTTLGTITTGTWAADKVGLAYGGTNADLSATGGVSYVLRQSSVGAAVTVSQLAASDLSNGTNGSGKVVLMTSDLSAGSTTLPSFTDNGDGSCTIGTGAYNLWTEATGIGLPTSYSISGGTFTPTDGAVAYIVANYNGGSPVVQMVTSLATIDYILVVPIFTIHRDGTTVIQLNWDTTGLALPNKMQHGIMHTMPFLYQDGLILGEAGTRNVTISSGTEWIAGCVETLCAAFNSSTDTLSLYYHVGGVETETTITQYNNSQYDDGTNLQNLTGNRYGVIWVWRLVSSSSKRAFCTLGNANYTLPDARSSQPVYIPSVASQMSVLVGRIIVQNGASSATQIDSAFTQNFNGATATTFSGISGTCATTQGGTGLTSYVLGDTLYASAANVLSTLAGNITTTRKFLRQVGNGAISAAPAWDTVTSTDVGLGNVENTALSTWAGSTNLTTLGTITTGTWSATAIGPTKGGTGQTTYALGDLLYSDATNSLAKLTGNTASTIKVLTQTGTGVVSAAPVWTASTGTGNVVFSSSPTITDTLTLTLTSTATAGTTPLLQSTITVAPVSTSTANYQAGRFVVDDTGTTVNTGTLNGLTSVLTHGGSGSAALTGINSSVTATGGNATNMFGIQSLWSTTGSTTLSVTVATGLRTALTLNNANASVATFIGCDVSWTLTTGTATTMVGVRAGAMSSATMAAVTTLIGVDINAITGTTAGSPATNAYAIRTANVTGASNNWQLNLGTGITLLNDTTDATTTTSGSFQTKGGMGIVKALWVGGLTNIAGVATLANTTEASAIGTAGTVIVGGVSVAKKAYFGSVTNYAAVSATTTNGDQFLDTTQNHFGGYTGGMNGWYDRTICSNTASKTQTGIVTAASIVPTSVIGSPTIPANWFKAGKRLRYIIRGTYSTDAAPGNATLTIKIGSTTFRTTGSFALDNSNTNAYWRMEGAITCQTTGASGTCVGIMAWEHEHSAGAGTALDVQTANSVAAVTFDTTVSNLFDVLWTADDSGTSIVCTDFLLIERA